MKKINDFGQKIGGAKKDIWAVLHDMDNDEKTAIARKAKLWKRPNYQFLMNSGADKAACYWIDVIRASVRPKAPKNWEDAYIRFVLQLKEDVEACATMADVEAFYKTTITKYLTNTPGTKSWRYASTMYASFFDGNVMLRYVYSGKRLKEEGEHFLEPKEDLAYKVVKTTLEDTQSTPVSGKPGQYRNTVVVHQGMADTRYTVYTEDLHKRLETEKELYLVIGHCVLLGAFQTEEEAQKAIEISKETSKKVKEAKEKKKKEEFLPPHLSDIQRTGSDYHFFRLTDGNILLTRYSLRGGEFGNYTAAKDRLGSLNMAFDAFWDLADAIGISAKDIGLGGDLAIAFGARGRGSAVAHYEPDRNVINMTKYRGAGSLAHEWAHALDYYIGREYGARGCASEAKSTANIPKSMQALVKAMKYQNGKETVFYQSSKKFDNAYKKAGNGYWASAREMFARAFACYVHDKLGDTRSDYLVGHAECAVSSFGSAVPLGAERETLNSLFDAFFADMVQQGVFSKPDLKKEEGKESTKEVTGAETEIMFFEATDGQLMFC